MRQLFWFGMVLFAPMLGAAGVAWVGWYYHSPLWGTIFMMGIVIFVITMLCFRKCVEVWDE